MIKEINHHELTSRFVLSNFFRGGGELMWFHTLVADLGGGSKRCIQDSSPVIIVFGKFG